MRYFVGPEDAEVLNPQREVERWYVKAHSAANPKRRQMLVEALHIIRELFDGEGYTNFRGEHFDVESAKLWDLPEKRVPIGVAS